MKPLPVSSPSVVDCFAEVRTTDVSKSDNNDDVVTRGGDEDFVSSVFTVVGLGVEGGVELVNVVSPLLSGDCVGLNNTFGRSETGGLIPGTRGLNAASSELVECWKLER